MPDNSKAPVWIVKNFLKDMFLEQAKSKKYDIEKLNGLVLNTQVAKRVNTNTAQPTSTSCSHCGKTFSSNSRPTSCPRCSQPKHSTKCAPCPLTNSTQIRSTASAPVTALAAASSSSSSGASLLQLPEVRSAESLALPQTSSPSGSVTGISNPSLSPTVPPISTTASLLPTSDSQALPSQVDTSQPVLPSQRQPKRKNKKSQHPVLPLSPKSSEISFLKQELSSAQTKITMLDADIDDLNKTIAIQKARLEIFENDQNEKVSNKYFESELRGRKSCSLRDCSSSPCCPRPPPTCCSAYHVHAPQAGESNSLLNTLHNKLLVISADIKAVKDTLKPPTKLSPPQPTQSMTNSEERCPTTPNAATDDATEPTRDMSMNSIEEFIFSPHQESILNINVPTNQLQ